MKLNANQLVGIAAAAVVVIPVGVKIVQKVAYQLTPEAAIDRQLAKERNNDFSKPDSDARCEARAIRKLESRGVRNVSVDGREIDPNNNRLEMVKVSGMRDWKLVNSIHYC